jgi:DNA-binding beta-propeller fold protein YncE
VLQAGTGIEFWDWTNVNNPVLLNHMTLPGVQFSDYGTGAWWLAWQAPYVFVGGSANGLYIVDATNPSSPTLLKQIPVSQTGGFRIHPVFPVGNLLVATSADFGGSNTGIVTMDISDPANPVVIRSQTTGIPVLYSSFFNGNKLIGLGNFDHSIHVWDLSNPAQFTLINSIGGMDRPVYATVQDGFALVGDETSFTKVDIRTGTFSIVGKGTSGLGDRSEDVITPLGNIAFVANDHGTGSAIIPHQLAPDNTGPSVNMISPANNATNQKLTSRVGITMTDWLDLASITQTTFIVRPLGGSALAGKYSTEQGIVNFSPNVPLLPNTTYEVVIPAGGIKDFSGNGVPTAFTSRFSTGGPVAAPTVQVHRNAPALVNQSVAFSIDSSSGSGTLTYSWDFGDGSPVTPFSSTSTASHTYTSAGHFPAKVTVSNGTAQSNSSFTQTIHHPATATKPSASSTIILDALRNRVWTVNPDTDTVTAINAANNTKFLERPVGKNPRTLAQAPDGSIWVVNQADATISILDRDSGNTLQTITLTPGSQPYGVVFSPDGASAYVSTQGTGQLIRLNPSTRAVSSTLNLNFPLRGLAVSSNSSRVFVTRFISPANQGEVVEVSASGFNVTRTFSLALDPGPDGNVAGRGVPNYLSALAVSPDGRQARVPSKKDNTSRGTFRDGLALNFESTVRTIVSQLDLLNNTAPLAARIDFNDRDMANAVVFSTLGDYVFVATQGTNTVEVLDAYDNRLMNSIDVDLAPQGLVLSADGRRLYVQNFMGRSVTVFDITGVVESTTNTVQLLATISTVATEKLTAQVLQGKRIFYNADDQRMNRDSYIACASCHLDGGSDERVWDFTDRGEGFRNTINLRGKRGVGQGFVHWTANFDEIQDFEHDIRGPFGGLGFMSDANFNSGNRNTPLGSPKAGFSAELDALSAYVTSLNQADPSPHRNADGSLTSAGQSGKTLFTTSCTACHSGPDFTDSSAGVLHNVGTIKASSGKRMGQTLTGLDTPGLKGVWNSAPYLHDGSASTLRDVLTTANPGGAHANLSGLSSAQIDQLVAYVQQIDEREAGVLTPTNTPTRTPTPNGPTFTPTPTQPITPGVVTRVRFFPRSTFANRMTGGIFQGSNTGTTSGFVNLVTITTQPTDNAWSELTFSNTTAYRYLRYLSPNAGFGNVAEI